MVLVDKNPLLFVVVLATIINGCVLIEKPLNNADFGNITNLYQLEGIYQNLGERDSDNDMPFYLSYLSIRDFTSVENSSINAIEIRVAGEGRLSVKALSKDGLVKEEIYNEGKDFTINSGRIRLKWKIGSATEGALGPYYETAYLGLDLRGEGKYRAGGAFVGIMFVIPIALFGYEDIRFVKLHD